MNTCDLRVELPEAMTADEAKVFLAVKLFEVGKASLGQAAKLAGFSKRAFMEVLGRQGVSVINYSADELREEVEG
jgi:predicted HTH domain antitoxin